MDLFQTPSFLKPGDTVQIIAPSGPFIELSGLEKGIEIWNSKGYDMVLGKSWNACHGYLAGTDDQRLSDLLEALQNPECKAIMPLRGGYGCVRLFETKQLNALLAKHPKWIIGFSDITVLLWKLASINIQSIHGPVLTTLCNEPNWSIERLFTYIQGSNLPPLKGEGWGGGISQGILLPANLTVATHLLGTPLQPSFNGTVLALEDIGEDPYKIDRILTQWRLMGIFHKVHGIVLGSFSQCNTFSKNPSWTVEEVLRNRLSDLNIPIVSNLPFGHGKVNAILPVGINVIINGDQGYLDFVTY